MVRERYPRWIGCAVCARPAHTGDVGGGGGFCPGADAAARATRKSVWPRRPYICQIYTRLCNICLFSSQKQ